MLVIILIEVKAHIYQDVAMFHGENFSIQSAKTKMTVVFLAT